MAYNPQVITTFVHNGNPNGSVAGNAANALFSGSPADTVQDTSTTPSTTWICETTGTTSTAVWAATGGGGGGSGTVTSVSVATSNGYAGSVSNPTTSPNITIQNTVSGLLKGVGSAVSTAIPGTDYMTPQTALTTTQFALINTSDIVALTSTALSAFTSTQLSAMSAASTTQIAALTFTQIGGHSTVTQGPVLTPYSIVCNNTSTNAPGLDIGTGLYLGGAPLVTVNVLLGMSLDPGSATYTQMNAQNVNATSGQTGYTATSAQGSDTAHYAGFYKNNSTGPSPTNAFWTDSYASSWYDIDGEMNIGVGPTLGAGNAVMNFYAGQYAAPNMALKNGLTMSGATGGDQGVGTVNATGLFVNGINPLLTWETITSSTTMIPGMGFAGTSASMLTCTLPSALTVNEMYGILSAGPGGFKIAVPSGLTLTDPIWGTVTAGGGLYGGQNASALMLATSTTQIEVIGGRGNLSQNGYYGPATNQNFYLTTCLLRGAAGNAVSDLSGNGLSLSLTNVLTSSTTTKQDLYSIEFPANAYITISSPGTAFNFPADFTIKFWINASAVGQSNGSFIMAPTSGSSGLYVAINGGASTIAYGKYGSPPTLTASTPIGTNAWVYCALVRHAGTVTWYINGVTSGSVSDSTAYTSSAEYIGGLAATATYLNGYIAGFQVEQYAEFLSNFTPPQAPAPISTY